jgi:hypothetical protein
MFMDSSTSFAELQHKHQCPSASSMDKYNLCVITAAPDAKTQWSKTVDRKFIFTHLTAHKALTPFTYVIKVM